LVAEQTAYLVIISRQLDHVKKKLKITKCCVFEFSYINNRS